MDDSHRIVDTLKRADPPPDLSALIEEAMRIAEERGVEDSAGSPVVTVS